MTPDRDDSTTFPEQTHAVEGTDRTPVLLMMSAELNDAGGPWLVPIIGDIVIGRGRGDARDDARRPIADAPPKKKGNPEKEQTEGMTNVEWAFDL